MSCSYFPQYRAEMEAVARALEGAEGFVAIAASETNLLFAQHGVGDRGALFRAMKARRQEVGSQLGTSAIFTVVSALVAATLDAKAAAKEKPHYSDDEVIRFLRNAKSGRSVAQHGAGTAHTAHLFWKPLREYLLQTSALATSLVE